MISPHLDNSFIYLKTLMPLAPTYLSTTDFPLTLTLSPIGEREKGRNLSLALAHHKLFSLSNTIKELFKSCLNCRIT